MKEKVNMRRAVPVLVIILSTFVLSGIFCYMQKLYPDEMTVYYEDDEFV